MNKDRRMTLLALLSGALAGLAFMAARRGFGGAGRVAARLTRPMQPAVKTELYGYKEIGPS